MKATVVVSGLPHHVTLQQIAYKIYEILDTDTIGRFHLREIIDRNCSMSLVALDFENGFDAMTVQDLLNGFQFTLRNGEKYKLAAKVSNNSEYLPIAAIEDSRAVGLYYDKNYSSTYPYLDDATLMEASKLDAQLVLLKKKKMVAEQEMDLVKINRQLRKELRKHDDSSDDEKSERDKQRCQSPIKSGRQTSSKSKRSKSRHKKLPSAYEISSSSSLLDRQLSVSRSPSPKSKPSESRHKRSLTVPERYASETVKESRELSVYRRPSPSRRSSSKSRTSEYKYSITKESYTSRSSVCKSRRSISKHRRSRSRRSRSRSRRLRSRRSRSRRSRSRRSRSRRSRSRRSISYDRRREARRVSRDRMLPLNSSHKNSNRRNEDDDEVVFISYSKGVEIPSRNERQINKKALIETGLKRKIEKAVQAMEVRDSEQDKESAEVWDVVNEVLEDVSLDSLKDYESDEMHNQVPDIGVGKSAIIGDWEPVYTVAEKENVPNTKQIKEPEIFYETNNTEYLYLTSAEQKLTVNCIERLLKHQQQVNKQTVSDVVDKSSAVLHGIAKDVACAQTPNCLPKRKKKKKKKKIGNKKLHEIVKSKNPDCANNTVVSEKNTTPTVDMDEFLHDFEVTEISDMVEQEKSEGIKVSKISDIEEQEKSEFNLDDANVAVDIEVVEEVIKGSDRKNTVVSEKNTTSTVDMEEFLHDFKVTEISDVVEQENSEGIKVSKISDMAEQEKSEFNLDDANVAVDIEVVEEVIKGSDIKNTVVSEKNTTPTVDMEEFLHDFKVTEISDMVEQENSEGIKVSKISDMAEQEKSEFNLDDANVAVDIEVVEEVIKGSDMVEQEKSEINISTDQQSKKIDLNKRLKFVIPARKITNQMRAHLRKFERDCQHLQSLLKSVLRDRLRELLKDKERMQTANVISLYRSKYPLSDDEAFMKEIVRTFLNFVRNK